MNTVGSHKCGCRPGFRLNSDNQTCIDNNQSAMREQVDTISTNNIGSKYFSITGDFFIEMVIN